MYTFYFERRCTIPLFLTWRKEFFILQDLPYATNNNNNIITIVWFFFLIYVFLKINLKLDIVQSMFLAVVFKRLYLNNSKTQMFSLLFYLVLNDLSMQEIVERMEWSKAIILLKCADENRFSALANWFREGTYLNRN